MTDSRIDVKTYRLEDYYFVQFTDVSNDEWWMLRLENYKFLLRSEVEINHKDRLSVVREKSVGLTFYWDGEPLIHNMVVESARKWWDKLQLLGFRKAI